MNNYTTTGRLTAPAEIRTTQTGKKIASFTLAINTGYGDNKSTLFLDCKAWEGLAETIVKYTDKGSQVAIAGNLNQESWEKDGQKRSKIVCTVKSLEFLSKSPQNTQEEIDVDEINIEGMPF